LLAGKRLNHPATFLPINHVLNKLDELSSIFLENHFIYFGVQNPDYRIVYQITMHQFQNIMLRASILFFPNKTGLIVYVKPSVTYKCILSINKHPIEAMWIEEAIKNVNLFSLDLYSVTLLSTPIGLTVVTK